jgi:hypothetical protein
MRLIDLRNEKSQLSMKIISKLIHSGMKAKKTESYSRKNEERLPSKFFKSLKKDASGFSHGSEESMIHIQAVLNPVKDDTQQIISILNVLKMVEGIYIQVFFIEPFLNTEKMPLQRFYRFVLTDKPQFKLDGYMFHF